MIGTTNLEVVRHQITRELTIPHPQRLFELIYRIF
jgi:hypothetical protein